MSTVSNGLSKTNAPIFTPTSRGIATDAPQAAARVTVDMLYLMVTASVVALAASVYLAYASFSMSDVAGCGGGGVFDCGHVLHSKWAKVVGVPVSVFAILTHVVLLGSLTLTQLQRCSERVRTIAGHAVLLASLAAASAAIYFIVLQVFALNHLCSYCLTAHASGLFLGVYAWRKLQVAWPSRVRLTALAVAGISMMAMIQTSSAEPQKFKIEPMLPVAPAVNDPSQATSDDQDDNDGGEFIFEAPSASIFWYQKLNHPNRQNEAAQWVNAITMLHWQTALNAAVIAPAQEAETESSESSAQTETEPAPKKRLVSIMNGSVKLVAKDWPLVGKPDAKHIFVEMFDYTCQHCRSTHGALSAAKQTLGDDLAIITLPVPMNRKCNETVKKEHAAHLQACELAKLAIAVWRVDKAQFTPFHEWLFEGQTAPTYDAALAKARSTVDAAALDDMLTKEICDKYIAQDILLYKKVGGGTIPKMIFKQTAVVGEFTSGSSLVDLIRQYTAQ